MHIIILNWAVGISTIKPAHSAYDELIQDKMYMLCFDILNGRNSMRQNYKMAWWASKIILEKVM